MKNYVRFFSLFMLLLSCAPYPDGEVTLKEKSFHGQDRASWQGMFKDLMVQSLSLDFNKIEFWAKQNQTAFKFVTLKGEEIVNDDEEPLLIAFDTLKAKSACSINPQSLFYRDLIDYLLVSDCEGFAARLYGVSIQSHTGAPLTAYLLWPHNQALSALPVFLFWHGHVVSHSKESVSFDFNSYYKAAGWHLAKAGFVTLVPTISTFENGKKEHYKVTKKMKAQNKNIFGEWMMEAFLWRSWLQTLPETDFERPIFPQNTFKGLFVGGVSLGSQIALWQLALDPQIDGGIALGGFYGFEVLNSKHHHFCQSVEPLMQQANIMDVALMAWPKPLYLGMGDTDRYYNNYSKSAFLELENQHQILGTNVCQSHVVGNDLTYPSQDCAVVVDIRPNVGHDWFLNTENLKTIQSDFFYKSR